MTCDLLRERERTKRRVLWTLASLHPGDSNASDLLAILDKVDDLERPPPVATSHSNSLRFVTLSR